MVFSVDCPSRLLFLAVYFFIFALMRTILFSLLFILSSLVFVWLGNMMRVMHYPGARLLQVCGPVISFLTFAAWWKMTAVTGKKEKDPDA